MPEAVSETPEWEAALVRGHSAKAPITLISCLPGPQSAAAPVYYLYRRHKTFFNVSLNNSTPVFSSKWNYIHRTNASLIQQIPD